MHRTSSFVRSVFNWSRALTNTPGFSRGARCALLAGAACCISACGGSDPKPKNEVVVGEGPLLPFTEGNQWTYRVTDGASITDKTTTIGGLEAIGGSGPHAADMAYKVVTRKGADLADQTESWQAPSAESPDRVLRFREISYGTTTQMPKLDTYWDPSKLHIDGREEVLVSDYTWLETYDETKIPYDGSPTTTGTQSDRWTIISLDESLTVAGKRYDHAIHFRKFSTAAKEYWYLRGVGKLKETGTQTEELVSFSLN
jgi:hypothetical protein